MMYQLPDGEGRAGAGRQQPLALRERERDGVEVVGVERA